MNDRSYTNYREFTDFANPQEQPSEIYIHSLLIVYLIELEAFI